MEGLQKTILLTPCNEKKPRRTAQDTEGSRVNKKFRSLAQFLDPTAVTKGECRPRKAGPWDTAVSTDISKSPVFPQSALWTFRGLSDAAGSVLRYSSSTVAVSVGAGASQAIRGPT